MYALLAIHVGKVSKRIEQTGMKIGSNPFFPILPEDRLLMYSGRGNIPTQRS